MISKQFVGALALLLAMSPLSLVHGQAKPEEKAAQIETKGAPRVSAASIDFQKSLGLPFDSLASLGSRIEHCRIAADPVGLAAAAKELAVAEAVSGKQAELSSASLAKQASELAKLRNSSQELTAVAMLSGDEAALELKKLAAAAKQGEADRASALAAGEEPKGYPFRVYVHNHCPQPVQIYHNGYPSGCVPAYGRHQIPCYGDRNYIYGCGPSVDFHCPLQQSHAHWHLHP